MKANIATIPKNATEEVRVSIDEYMNRDLVSVRVWCDPYSGDTRVPTKKGLSVAIGKLPQLIEALQQAESAAREAGLLGAEGQAAAE